MNPIVFLDIDGVLNSIMFFRRQLHRAAAHHIDRAAVANVNLITEEMEADVVISSSWRHDNTEDQLAHFLAGYGLMARVVGMTPVLGARDTHDGVRSREIEQYIEENGVERFVILDDVKMQDRWLRVFAVRVDPMKGLTPEDAQQAVDILQSMRVPA